MNIRGVPSSQIFAIQIDEENSDLREYIYTELEKIVLQSNHKVISRRERDIMYTIVMESLHGEFDEKLALELGKFLTAHYFLSAQIINLQGKRQFQVRLFKAETDEIVGVGSVEIEL